MNEEANSNHPCKWCGEPAWTYVNVTDITTHPRRDYKEYKCERCWWIEERIYANLEAAYGEVWIDELAQRMNRALRRRGVVRQRLERAMSEARRRAQTAADEEAYGD